MIAFLAISATLFPFLGLLNLWAFNIIPNFQNMFITRGTCDLVLGNICSFFLLFFTFNLAGSL